MKRVIALCSLLVILCLSVSRLMAKGDLPIEIFVMSKCPDAMFTEATFDSIVPLAGAKVTFEFIADPETLVCKHGESECRGNQLELAVQQVVPNATFSFLKHFNARPEEIGDESDDRLLALLHDTGLSDAETGSVIALYQDELDSGDLLRRSAAYTKSLGIVYSATVRIDGEVVGIRDGGQWREMKHGIDGSSESWKDYIESKVRGRSLF